MATSLRITSITRSLSKVTRSSSTTRCSRISSPALHTIMYSSERGTEGHKRNSELDGPAAPREKSSSQHLVNTSDKDGENPQQGNSYRNVGRGRGRGRGQGGARTERDTARRPSVRKLSSKARNIEVVTSNFESMHKKCRAARYRVHKPGCNCYKVKQARSSTEKLDGLVVVPDVKQISSVYLCLGTGRDEFQRDHLASENKLKDEIFAQSSSPVDTANPSFDVSCAICLLQIEPNGFVCVSSSSHQTVDFVRDMARKRAEQKRKDGPLHGDHAHYICTLPRRILWQLCDKARTREQKRQATNELVELYLGRQGVPTDTTDTCEQIEIGHHLWSFLFLTKDESDADTAYWMTLVYDNTSNRMNPSWTLDLPGGRRHLGERSFEGAIRETEEESSLQIDRQWMLEDGPRRHSRNDVSPDYFYMIGPPSDLLMGAMTDNPFWQNPGFCKEPES
jgi:hypothetical protein